MESNVAVLLIDYDPTKPDIDFRCGNNMFSEIEWDFNGLISAKHLSGARLKMKFQFTAHRPEMAEVIKWFMVHELITGKFPTAKRSLDGIIRFIKFIDKRFPDVMSFLSVTPSLLKSYFEYLLEAKNETTGKPLSGVSITKCGLAIKDILIKGNVKGWDVPADVRFVQGIYEEMIIFNKALKKDKHQAEQVVIDRINNENILDRIVKIAMNDLENDVHIPVAASVIISTQLGLRISELLNMFNASIEQVGGDSMLVYFTEKLHAEPVRVYKPANELVIYAVTKLQSYARPLQQESGLPYLFLGRKRNITGCPVSLVSHSNWNKNFLRPWIKKHQIYVQHGQFIDFTSHTFRHAFATYALKGGASIEVISELMNHKSIRGTTVYTHLLQEDVKKQFAKVFHEGAIISGKKALQIKDKLKQQNPFRGKTMDQVDKLRRAMKIQVLSHGICLHHPMRNEPCAGDGVCMGCQNFLTTPDFLEVHKGRLDKIQKELETVPATGPYEQKLKTIESYLVGIINDLEKQMVYVGKANQEEYMDADSR
jgi:site-specific recombinase XerD